ncbi:MAG: phenylalanine--tRNA ligase subunit beta [Phycisphaeraceae bacterium]
MNASLAWLNSYLDRPVTADEADRVLTEVGFPLDGLEEGDGDALLDVEVTSNRSDCLSHVGLAREIAAATGRVLNPPAPPELIPPEDAPEVRELTSVENQEPALCPLYTARVIKGVKVGPSPAWLVERLEAVGLRPVNNIVDVTNFVLHEMGQPLHAFDLAKLAGQRIVVRKATAGEAFTAIDGSTHKLRDDMLVIADAERPQAVAGVMGGRDSEVTEGTTDVLLESARFDPLSVRSTSRALKLASDSSYRFERGVDPLGVDRASQRAAELILEVAGGKLAQGVIAEGETPPLSQDVELRLERCQQLLGIEIPAERMLDLLTALELKPRFGGESIICTIPSHRLDLHREVDLIEEVARLHGYDAIPTGQKVHIVARPPQTSVQARQTLNRVLIAHGYHEAITFSFLPPDHAKLFAEGVELAYVDQDKKKAEPALRPSVLPSLLASRKANQDAGNQDVRLFEVASVFGQREGRYVESRKLALLADAATPAEALREMRGTLEELLEHLGLSGRVRIAPADPSPQWASPAAVLVDVDDATKVLGHYGPATDAVMKQFDLQTPVLLAELDYAALIAAYPPQPEVKPLPRFPAIERDLSIIVDEATPWADIERTVREAEVPLMERVDFVMVYRGKPVPSGRKSVTLKMIFRDPQRTLEHEEVTEQVQSVVGRLRESLAAELRT